MMKEKIGLLFEDLLEKYKQSQIIVIMNDSGKHTHQKLAALDKEIEEIRSTLNSLLEDMK